MGKFDVIERKLSSKQRENLKDSQFGIPELRSYPLNDPSHVEQAIRMFNYVAPKYESELASNIIKAIKKFNLTVNVGDTNKFKKYCKEDVMKNYSKVTENILSGMSVREAIVEYDSNKTIVIPDKLKAQLKDFIKLSQAGGIRYWFDPEENAYYYIADNPDIFNFFCKCEEVAAAIYAGDLEKATKLVKAH